MIGDGAVERAGRVVLGLATRVLRMLSALVPRDPNRWVFASRSDAYVDNPRYLFEYLVDLPRTPGHPSAGASVRACWISGSPDTVARVVADGRPALLRRSLRGAWEALRAGVAVYAFDISDVSLSLTGGALGVNLYHGVPLKQIEDLITVGAAARVYHPLTLADRVRAATVYFARTVPNDLVLATSDEVAATMARAFGPRARSIVVGRPPRLGPPLEAAQRRRTGAVDRPSVLLYAPTWRQGGFQLADALPDLARLDAALARSGTRLVIKGHLYDRLSLARAATNISVIGNEEELGTILGDVDGVITDYSSVMFDAALVGVPVLFYPFDLDRYRAESSESFMFDYDELVATRVAWDFDELTAILAAGSWRQMAFPATIRDRVWGSEASDPSVRANEELVDHIAGLARTRHGTGSPRRRRSVRPGARRVQP